MMKLVSMLLTLCMVFCMLTVPAAADDLPVVKLDVGTTETYDDTNYNLDSRKRDEDTTSRIAANP